MASFIVNEYVDILFLKHLMVIGHLSNILFLCACVLNIFVFPFFIHSLLGIDLSIIRKRIFIIIDAVYIAVCVYYILTYNQLIKFLIIKQALLLFALYGFVIIVTHLNSIGDKTLSKAIKFFFIVSAIFWPLIFFELYRNNLSLLKDFPSFKPLTLPLYFIIINLLGIVFSIKYFNQPPFLENNSLSAYFKKKYDITEREMDIITRLIEGLSNNEISEKLFISTKTVENHLSNIYAKVDVKNRVQLVNIVLTNK